MQKRLHLLAGVLMAAALAFAACGGDDDPVPEPADQAEQTSDQTEETPDQADEAEEPADQTVPDEAEDRDPAEDQTTQPDPADDPNRELLSLGETFSASITEIDGVRQFRFEADEGALIRVSVDGKAGMDPIVTLLEPNRNEIKTEDDVSPGANRDAVLIARLPSAGLQVVRVVAFGTSIGDFEITIEQLAENADSDSQILTIDSTVIGSIWEPADIDIYEFQGAAGQRLRIYVDGAISVDLVAQVFAPNGSFITTADDSGHGLDPEILLTLPDDGTYRVEVFAFGNKIGPYEFSVSTVPEDPPADDPAILEEIANTALAYLAALQDGDTLNMFALAGPEAIAFRGWESAADVEFDLLNITQTVAGGEPGTATATLDGERGRVTVALIGSGQTMRFDMISVGGRWFVDLWSVVADA